MFNYEIGTPCPAPAHGGREVASPFGSKQNNIFDDAFDQFNDNTTQNIAHLVQQEFKNAPPRRTQNLARKPRRAPTTIFEDASSSSQREPYRRDEPAGMMRSSAIHARPAQRIRIQTSREEKPATLPTSSSSDIANFKPTISTNKPVNEDRRRTIWIPEDTTLLSIHPGAYDHTLRDETVGLPSSQLDISPMKETPQPVRMGASAMRQAQKMASTSKRSALRPLAPSQPNVSNSVMGTGGGKENVLPGALLSRTAKGEKPLVKPMSKAAPLGTSRSQSSLQQTMSVKKRPAPELKDAPKPKARALHERASVRNEVLPRPANLDPFSRDFKHKPLPAPKQAASKPPSARPVSQNFAPKDVNTRPVSSTIPPRDVSLPNLKRSAFLAASRYPVLSDDLGQPELYEDNWLQNQEVALTQLVNVVFQQAHESSAANDVAALRSRMLTLYHDASVATLHQRLKASLSYGALSMPKDSSQSPKLRDDIGLRRQFFDLFGHTYDSEALQAAAEVVVGRVITPAADHTRSRVTASSSTGIKEWKRFCSTFFVDHEDSAELLTAHDVKSSEGSTTQPGTPEWFWQRTVLRGLMLIHLLDQVKSTGKLSTCLFQASSPHKSSISVLRAFAKLMVPSVGDISRSLGHLGYSVRHVQQPLEEYTYRIDNLAVDLRDGVLLAHFVELLLYPSRNLDDRSDRTITFDLPDGETLTSFLDSNSTTQILSQHLKFPCNSKVQKMHNVQVALSALTGARGLAGTAIETIKAEDIVNGHREKTLSLLWALVSRWGLGYLVDWDELKKETLRFSKFSTQPVGINYALSAEQPDTNEQGPLLKEWAASVCQQHKVIVTNLTTSFADGRALAAIISTYADYVPASTKKSSNKMSTADRLRNLGCSESFITLFASQATTIPSRSNTIALLAFLSSRLLPLARTHRAACAIQNAYRLRLARRNISLRIQKMRAATDCAAVAANKQREVDAAVTLQRAWRAVLDRRIECLERDVLAFQSMARGWAVRRATAGVLGTGSGRRVMGGW